MNHICGKEQKYIFLQRLVSNIISRQQIHTVYYIFIRILSDFDEYMGSFRSYEVFVFPLSFYWAPLNIHFIVLKYNSYILIQ